MIQPKVGSTIRAVTAIGTGLPRLVYAQVLSIAPILDEHLGADGEPTLSIAYMDNPDPRKLGQVDWHSEFQRHAGVRHVSHEDFVNRKVSIGWLDALPEAGHSLDDSGLGDVDARQLFPIPDAPVLTATEALPAPPNDTEKARGGVNKMASIESLPGRFPIDSEVEVEGKMTRLEDLKAGMYIPDLKLFVQDVEWEAGVLYIGTSTSQAPTGGDTQQQTQGANAVNAEKATGFPVGQSIQQSGENGQIVGAPAGIAPGDAAQHPPLDGVAGTGSGDGMGIRSATPEELNAKTQAYERDQNASAEAERVREQEAGGTKTDAAAKGDDAPIE